MTEPYLGEIRLFGFNFAPRGWAACDGSLLSISEYEALYSILGTTYGGDGRTTFALPDLRGRVPIHQGDSGTTGSSNHSLGQKSGEEDITLTEVQMPNHTHVMHGSNDSALSGFSGQDPTNHILATASTNIYTSAANLTTMNAISIGNSGSNESFSNMQPFLAVEFCMAIIGLFPPRN